MVGLLDISKLTRTVNVNGEEVETFGVSLAGVAVLLDRFPELRKLLSGQQVTSERLMELAPSAVAAIIAAGTGYPGDAKAEEVAGRLPLESQIDFLQAIIELTLPKGVGPFVDRIIAMGEAASQIGVFNSKAVKDQGTNSQPEQSD